jgi:cyclophilin family peptidyl-prolyl cis-trans isomerase
MKNIAYLLVLFFVACSPQKFFRKLNKTEAAEVKAAKKLVPKKATEPYVLIITDSGNMIVRLYNETPLHRDNFVRKVKDGFYDSLLFHRVINNFMIQGGDPDSKLAKPGVGLGSGEAAGSKIPAEIRDTIFHKKGVIAAARDGNPEKASSNCQFYIAQGKIYKPDELENYIKQRNLKLNDVQKKLYTTIGGIPHLDGNYTVFGELLTGTNVIDKIIVSKTERDRPVKDIRMKMFLIYVPKANKF